MAVAKRLTSSLTLTLAVCLSGAAWSEPVFVDVKEGLAMIEAGAQVLDARGTAAAPPYLPNAHVVEWKDLRGGTGRSGKLAPPEAVKRAMEAIGVRSDRPVLVYGAMQNGWGEEGRIWWTLRYLGHDKVKILDGGIDVWKKSGARVVGRPASKPSGGKLQVAIKDDLRADWRAVDDARKSGSAQIIDSRTSKEYLGATPYWSYRGGHVPKARHFFWRDTIGKDGKLLDEATLKKRFAKAGLALDKPIITYCTGGVRSAFLQAVFRHVDAPAKNYDGSWWEWASRTNLPVEKPKRR